jgi:uncharacterized membrane protein YecN with MAPEG domain
MDTFNAMTPAQAAALWSGLLLLGLMVLSVRVVLNRRKHKVLLGDGKEAQITLRSRVFGNAAEYIPVGVGALALLAMLGMPAMAIHAVGGVLLAGRLIHAAGLSDKKPTFGRVLGMALTYFALFTAGGMLVVHAFV